MKKEDFKNFSELQKNDLQKEASMQSMALVGCTGFVGGNLAAKGNFDGLYHSSNIEEAFGTKPELLIYAGLRAEKFLAEKFPERDLESIENAKENIRKIAPKRIVLISTIEVYDNSFHKTESDPAIGSGAYGKNRVLLEQWVEKEYPDHLIIRLPGLFGKGIKKNFIYDYIHFIPALLKEDKFKELSERNPLLKDYYALNENGFFQLQQVSQEERKDLKEIFKKLNFSALNFTDSRGVFQYYNLAHLYDDILLALDHKIRMLNITSEPVSIAEIYAALTGKPFVNEISASPPYYDARTLYYQEWNGLKAAQGTGGYMYTKQQVLNEIKQFTEGE